MQKLVISLSLMLLLGSIPSRAHAEAVASICREGNYEVEELVHTIRFESPTTEPMELNFELDAFRSDGTQPNYFWPLLSEGDFLPGQREEYFEGIGFSNGVKMVDEAGLPLDGLIRVPEGTVSFTVTLRPIRAPSLYKRPYRLTVGNERWFGEIKNYQGTIPVDYDLFTIYREGATEVDDLVHTVHFSCELASDTQLSFEIKAPEVVDELQVYEPLSLEQGVLSGVNGEYFNQPIFSNGVVYSDGRLEIPAGVISFSITLKPVFTYTLESRLYRFEISESSWLGIIKNESGYSVTENDIYFRVYGDTGTAAVSGRVNTRGNLTIPKVVGNSVVQAVLPNAFSNNTFLDKLSLPGTIKWIGSNAFSGNRIRTLIVPDSVEFIGANAFQSNTMIRVEFGSSLKVIEDGAFSSNNLEDLTLPEGISKVGNKAFETNKLTSLTVPDGADNLRIGDNAFKSNQIIDLYLGDGTKSIGYWSFGENLISSLRLPTTLESIGKTAFIRNRIESLVLEGRQLSQGAFWQNPITSVQVGTSVREFGDRWCYQCPISQVSFEEGGLQKIPDRAFQGFAISNELKIPNSIEAIGDNAFSGNALEVVELGDGLIELGQGAFANNQITQLTFGNSIKILDGFSGNRLASLDIPDAVVEIKDEAFADNQIETLSLGTSVEVIGGFSGNRLTSLVIPDSVREIRNGAFASNLIESVSFGSGLERLSGFEDNKLTDIAIPESVRHIGINAFRGNMLESLNTLNVVQIGSAAFQSNNIAELLMGDVLEEVGDYAFHKNRITALTFGPALRSIGDYAFSANFITGVDFPASLETIGESAFRHNRLEYFQNLPLLESIPEFLFLDNRLTGELIIPEGVKNIGQSAFHGNSFTEINLPETLETIGISAFSGIYSTILTVNFPPNLKHISDYAFGGSALEVAVLPEGILSIGRGAFAYTPLKYVFLPSSLVSIGTGAFYGAPLEEIDLAMKSIPYLFYDRVAKGASWEPRPLPWGHLILRKSVENWETNPERPDLKDNGGFGGASLSRLTIEEGVTSIGERAFLGNEIKVVEFPESLTLLGKQAFLDAGIERLYFSSGITSIPEQAFYGNKIQNLDLPGSVKRIGRDAFGRNAMSSLKLNEGVENIEALAFERNQISLLALPASIVEIGEQAFISNDLDRLYFLGDRPELPGDNQFLGNGDLLYLNFCDGTDGWPGEKTSDLIRRGVDCALDSDGDTYLDYEDVFPLDSKEFADTDADTVGDFSDNCLSVANLDQQDQDLDSVGNACDSDDDNDGVQDSEDAFPLVSLGLLTDTDKDGRPNDCDESCQASGMVADADDDNDGVVDEEDAFPLISLDGLTDTDTDGFPNDCDDQCARSGMVADSDDDNDGVLDTEDAFPLNASETRDTDGDGTGDNVDPDDDNDGLVDSEDPKPFDSTNLDTDEDGVVDDQDAFPDDPAASVDTDADGLPDDWNEGKSEADSTSDPGLVLDDDDDNDQVLDSDDAFPLDASESADTDGDGIGNITDEDDDGDGISDAVDGYPLISIEELTDTDKDGFPDDCEQECLDLGMTGDLDDDNDGVVDVDDAFPLDATESLDTDGDGIGNNADFDDDGDGTLDVIDAFPLDPEENTDLNNNGIGDNADLAALEALLAVAREEGRAEVTANPSLYGLITGAELDAEVAERAQAIIDDPVAYGIQIGFDLDGDGTLSPLTDGLLLLRYLFGFSGEALIRDAIGDGAERGTAEEVEAYIKERIPVE